MLAILSCKCPDHSKGSSAERAGKKKERLIDSVMNERMKVGVKRAIKFFVFFLIIKFGLCPRHPGVPAPGNRVRYVQGTLGDSVASGPETYCCGDDPVTNTGGSRAA